MGSETCSDCISCVDSPGRSPGVGVMVTLIGLGLFSDRSLIQENDWITCAQLKDGKALVADWGMAGAWCEGV